MSDIPWKKVYDLVLSCGNIHSPKEFAIEIVRQAELFVPFDHARIYFVNEKRRIYDQYVIGIDPRWVTAYLEYYSQIEDGRYNIFKRIEKTEGGSHQTGSWAGRLEQYLCFRIYPGLCSAHRIETLPRLQSVRHRRKHPRHVHVGPMYVAEFFCGRDHSPASGSAAA